MGEVYREFGVPDGQIPYAARFVDGQLVGVSYDPTVTEYLNEHKRRMDELLAPYYAALSELGLTDEEYVERRGLGDTIPEVEAILADIIDRRKNKQEE